MPIVRSISRFIAVCGVAFWLGGFTFHAGLIIPAGRDVLGSRNIGVITQRVTETLNVTGVAKIALLLLNSVLEWGSRPMFQRIARALTCLLLAITLLLRCRLHSRIRYTLENTDRSIRDHLEFPRLHTTCDRTIVLQWFSGLTHLRFVIGLPLTLGSAKRPDAV